MPGIISAIRDAAGVLRPADPEFAAAMAAQWAELPETARTPAQTLGRHGVGCEGTHGVFPTCNLACTPCYHSRDANQVRVDGSHTWRRCGSRWPCCTSGDGDGQADDDAGVDAEVGDDVEEPAGRPLDSGVADGML